MQTKKLNDVQASIGYKFQSLDLLQLALSHRSVGKKNNERMEFLGDSILNFIITKLLFEKFPQGREGDLTRLRANLVKGETLADVAKELALGEHLLLGAGELKSGGHRRASILADAVEAIIGAIFMDSGLSEAETSIKAWYQSRLDDLDSSFIDKDPKTKLQEYLQERSKPLPSYRVVSENGKLHDREYVVHCAIFGFEEPFVAQASSKRAAEKSAAHKALKALGL